MAKSRTMLSAPAVGGKRAALNLCHNPQQQEHNCYGFSVRDEHAAGLTILKVMRCLLGLLKPGGERRMVLAVPLRDAIDNRLGQGDQYQVKQQPPAGAETPVAGQDELIPAPRGRSGRIGIDHRAELGGIRIHG